MACAYDLFIESKAAKEDSGNVDRGCSAGVRNLLTDGAESNRGRKKTGFLLSGFLLYYITNPTKNKFQDSNRDNLSNPTGERGSLKSELTALVHSSQKKGSAQASRPIPSPIYRFSLPILVERFQPLGYLFPSLLSLLNCFDHLAICFPRSFTAIRSL